MTRSAELRGMIDALRAIRLDMTGEAATQIRLAEVALTTAIECIEGTRDAFTGEIDAMEGRR